MIDAAEILVAKKRAELEAAKGRVEELRLELVDLEMAATRTMLRARRAHRPRVLMSHETSGPIARLRDGA